MDTSLVICFLVALAATTAGALTGMGGVIIKPGLDGLGHYDVRSVSMLSAITVFSMAVVSMVTMLRKERGGDVPKAVVIPLAVGLWPGAVLETRSCPPWQAL